MFDRHSKQGLVDRKTMTQGKKHTRHLLNLTSSIFVQEYNHPATSVSEQLIRFDGISCCKPNA